MKETIENESPYEGCDYVGEFNLKWAERNLMVRALRITNGSVKLSSQIIGISEKNFFVKIKRHQLEKEVKNIRSSIIDRRKIN